MKSTPPATLDDAEMDQAQGGEVVAMPFNFRIETDGSVNKTGNAKGNVFTTIGEGESCGI